jgi:hypothetical protein
METVSNTRYETAIDALVLGSTITEAAKASGYSRETLSRLRHGNPVFVALLNKRRAEACDVVTGRLRELIDKLAGAVIAALDSPDLSSALVVQAGLSAIPKLAQMLATSYPTMADMKPGAIAEQMGLVENPLLKVLDTTGEEQAKLEVCKRAEKELAITN